MTNPLRIDSYRPLSPNEAGGRARRAAEGDSAARLELLASVSPMVRDAAKLFAYRRHKSRLLDDLIAEGLAGVWSKAHLYDPARGAFSTFAWRVASNAFADVVGELAYPARLPMYLVETNGEREAASEEVHRAAARIAQAPEPIGVRPTFLLDPADRSTGDPAESIDRADLLQRLCGLRRILSRRERRVLAMRFRLDRTHKEIGKWLGVSYETARQDELRAIKKLQRAMGAAL